MTSSTRSSRSHYVSLVLFDLLEETLVLSSGNDASLGTSPSITNSMALSSSGVGCSKKMMSLSPNYVGLSPHALNVHTKFLVRHSSASAASKWTRFPVLSIPK